MTDPAQAIDLTRLPDTRLDRYGWDVRSHLVERWWLPLIGPTTLLVARHFADVCDDRPHGAALRAADVARRLGVPVGDCGRHGPLGRSIQRLSRWRFAQCDVTGPVWSVRMRLAVPAPSAHYLDRYPDSDADAFLAALAGAAAVR